MRKKVLVVGGSGYIGGSVTEILHTKKIPFTVYDNLMYEKHYLKPVDFVYGDIRDTKKLGKIIRDYSHVIWLAAIVGDPACDVHPRLTKQVNQDAVAWLAQHFDGRIIFSSTVAVYGNSLKPATEEYAVDPISLYAQTKIEAEKYLIGKDALILRLGTAFGISDSYCRIRMDLGVNAMTMSAVKHKKITIYNGSQWRSFIHVKDIASTIVHNLFEKRKGIYNLATEKVTITQIAQKIHRATGCEVHLAKGSKVQESNYNVSGAKAKRDHIFAPGRRHTLSAGIREIAELTHSGRVVDFDFSMYSNVRYLTETVQRHI